VFVESFSATRGAAPRNHACGNAPVVGGTYKSRARPRYSRNYKI